MPELIVEITEDFIWRTRKEPKSQTQSIPVVARKKDSKLFRHCTWWSVDLTWALTPVSPSDADTTKTVVPIRESSGSVAEYGALSNTGENVLASVMLT